MFDALSDRFDGIFKRLRGKGTPQPRPTSTRSCGRSASPCSRPTSTSQVVQDLHRPHPRAGRRRRAVGGAEPGPAGHQDRPRGAHHHPRRRDASRSPTPRKPPTVVLMAGLQGSGKTTNSAKLARWFKQQGRNPLLVGADLQRPAAVEQLRTLGRQIDVPVFCRAAATRSSRRRGRPRRGPPPRPRRAHRRHRRPPGHRRRADGAGAPDLRGHRAPTTRSSSSTP